MKKSTQLRQLLAKKQLIVAPGCFDALTVLLAQKAGFSVAYLSGFGVSVPGSAIGNGPFGSKASASRLYPADFPGPSRA